MLILYNPLCVLTYTADNPPADDRPEHDPPADNPPADDRPEDDPPADNPPHDRPADNPPADDPTKSPSHKRRKVSSFIAN